MRKNVKYETLNNILLRAIFRWITSNYDINVLIRSRILFNIKREQQ